MASVFALAGIGARETLADTLSEALEAIGTFWRQRPSLADDRLARRPRQGGLGGMRGPDPRSP